MKYPNSEPTQEGFWIDDQFVEIDGSPEQIWPWLAQMGNGRAGWYSYDLIDNLGRPSLKFINPEFTEITKGQKIPFAVIVDFIKNQSITFQFGASSTLTYFLEPMGPQTRLWTRLKAPEPALILKYTLGPAHTFMQRKQFHEIKKRVEQKP
jgi:hypothetical protein